MSKFESITAYDSPGVILNQFLNDSVTMESVFNTFVRPNNLSPVQRENYRTLLKDKHAGESKLGRALIGIATNPFVWLTIGLSPPGARAVQSGTKIFTQNARLASKNISTNSDFLQQVGALDAHDIYRGTSVVPILQKVKGTMDELGNEVNEILEPALNKMAKRLSVKHDVVISPQDIMSGNVPSNVKSDVAEAKRLVSAALEKRYLSEESNVRRVMGITEDGKSVIEEIPIKQLVNENVMNARLSALGADELVTAMRKSYNTRYAKLILDEDNFKLYQEALDRGESIEDAARFIKKDQDKLDRIFRSFTAGKEGNVLFNANAVEKFNDFHRGADLVEQLLGADAALLFKQGKLSKEVFDEFIDVTFINPMRQQNYVPRNNLSPLVDHRGRARKIGGIHSATTPAEIAEYSSEFNIASNFGDTAEATKKSNLIQKGLKETTFDPEDLDYFINLANTPGAEIPELAFSLRNQKERTISVAKSRYANNEGVTLVDPMDPFANHNRYMRKTGETYAYHVAGKGGKDFADEFWSPLIADVDANIKDAQRIGGKSARELKATYSVRLDDADLDIPLSVNINKAGAAPKGGWSVADLLEREYKLLNSMGRTQAKEVLSDLFIPKMANRLSIKHTSTLAAQYSSKIAIDNFAKGTFGKGIRRYGGSLGNKFVDKLENLASVNLDKPLTGRNVHERIASYLYVSHLGVNLGSVMLNLTQPFLHTAAWSGTGNVVKAYGQAVGDMLNYTKQRIAKHGFGRISNNQRSKLIQDNLTHAELIGIQDDLFKNLDDAISTGVGGEPPSMARWLSMDLPMKMFEKTEWLNRLVTAHTVDNLYKQAGTKAAFIKGSSAYFNRLQSIQEMVDKTQFGGTALNQPLLFQGAGPIGRVGDLPTARQFLSFPMKAFTSLVRTSQDVGGGRRFLSPILGGAEIPQFAGRYTAPMADFARSMGIGAVIYKASKEMLGADMTRGLGASAYFEILPFNEIMNQNQNRKTFGILPTPPILDIAVNMVSDGGLTGQSFARLLPGGVSLSRALSISTQADPSSLFGLPQAMQKKYVDWNKPNEKGMYPVYMGDGRFVEYRDGKELVLKGLGMDLGRYNKSGELDGYLLKQREIIRDYKRRALAALMSNDIEEYNKIDLDFRRKYRDPKTGEELPLTITRTQLRSFIDNRNKARTERIYDQLDKNVRSQYEKLFAGEADRVGIPEHVILNPEAKTAKARSQFFDRNSNLNLTPETEQFINKMMRDQKEKEFFQEPSFIGYKPYGTE